MTETEDQRKARQIREFREKLTLTRNAERGRKGLPALAADPFADQPSPPPAPPRPAPPPPRRSPERDDWEATVAKLERLVPVIRWGEGQREGTDRLFGRLADQCRLAAENDHPDEYRRLKAAFLAELGALCELYFAGHLHYESVDILSFGLGMKEIRLQGSPSPDAGNERDPRRVHFFAREIPLLCCATPDELRALCAVKEALPGAAAAPGAAHTE